MKRAKSATGPFSSAICDSSSANFSVNSITVIELPPAPRLLESSIVGESGVLPVGQKRVGHQRLLAECIQRWRIRALLRKGYVLGQEPLSCRTCPVDPGSGRHKRGIGTGAGEGAARGA